MPSDIPATSEVILKTDSSKDFLDALLGQGWSNWGQGLGGEAASELMLQIFGAFNMVALAIISALFLWVSAVAVAGTAHEGVAFGKRYSSLWMPVRFVGAMGALAPIFKGLSLFQIALLACIGWSINLGNYVWELGTNYFVEHAGQITVQAPDQTVPEYNRIANGVLKSLTMQYYMSSRRGLDISPGGEWNEESTWYFKKLLVYRFNGSMGSIELDWDENNLDIFTAKRNAVSQAITDLSYTARQLADPDSPPPPPDNLSKAANNIHLAILKGMQSYSASVDTILNKKLKSFQSIADQYGWFMAGSSYWSISWINQEVRDAMYSGIHYEGNQQTKEELAAWMYGLHDYDAIVTRLDNYIQTGYTDRKLSENSVLKSPTVVDDSSTISISGMWDYIRNKIINNALPGDIVSWSIEKMAKNDPIMVISNLGDTLVVSAWGLFYTLAGANIFTGPLFVAIISFLFSALFLPLMLYGLVLAYYVPAIPFLRWISAITGWVILIVESMVAAPLWIAAHALPEGEGAAGQHGRRGYMLFLAIVIRPPLMVAGFFCAVILMNIMGRLIGGGFDLFFNGVAQTKIMGITGTFSMLVILGVTVIMLANKFFGLIHYIPEHVTNWIGQQMHSLGEKEDQAGAKAVFVGSTDAVSSAGRGTPQAIKDVKNAYAEQKATKASQAAGSGANSIMAASSLERSLASSSSSSSPDSSSSASSSGGSGSFGGGTSEASNSSLGGTATGSDSGSKSRDSLSERDLAAGRTQASPNARSTQPQPGETTGGEKSLKLASSSQQNDSGIQQTGTPPVSPGKGVQETGKQQSVGKRPTAPVTDKSLR